MKITDQVWEFAEPLVKACGCSLWDVEYVREGGEWFLRLYLDKEGGVDIDDCEAVSRAVDPVLDEKDPIPESYRFEVCSAGLERQLKRPSDFERYLGEPVLVKLYRPRDVRQRFAHLGRHFLVLIVDFFQHLQRGAGGDANGARIPLLCMQLFQRIVHHISSPFLLFPLCAAGTPRRRKNPPKRRPALRNHRPVGSVA